MWIHEWAICHEITVSYVFRGGGGVMFISVACENIHICETTSNIIKNTRFHDIPVVFKSHTVFLRNFQAPTGRRALATHKRSYRPATLESLKKSPENGSCAVLLWWESEAGCSWSVGQMLAGRFWLCVLSLGLAFIRSPVTGWSAKWAPMWADCSCSPTSKIVAGCKRRRHACSAMHLLHTLHKSVC